MVKTTGERAGSESNFVARKYLALCSEPVWQHWRLFELCHLFHFPVVACISHVARLESLQFSQANNLM